MPIIKSGYAKQRRRRTSEYEHNRRVILGYATRCSITGKAPTPDDPLEIDHIVPIADGGTDHITNLRAVLRSVNRQRGRGSTGGPCPSVAKGIENAVVVDHPSLRLTWARDAHQRRRA